ncbi:MAG: lysophospholipase, partial [Bdellovibrionota bacterium]
MQIERREGNFRSNAQNSAEEVELFFQSWTTRGARGTLVVTHGISEHSESYAKTADDLCKLGWNVVAWDIRGHGRSEGKRGHVDDFVDYSRDLAVFLRHLKRHGLLEKPFALVGHSMGGLITLRYLIDSTLDAPRPGAVALSSPLLGVALAVPPVKEYAAKFLNRVWPSMTLQNEIKYDDLVRDSEWLKTYEKDPLRHDKISSALYLGMFGVIDEVKASGAKITLPFLLMAAGQERIVSLSAIKEFFPTIASTNKKLLVYEDSYHEIMNDLDRGTVIGDLDRFVSDALGLGTDQ